jgi:hypothetical protein
MSRDMTLIIVGLLTIAVPTLQGFPSPIRTVILVICGAIVVIIGFIMRSQNLSKPKKAPEQHSSFQESVRPTNESIPSQPMSDIRPLE